MTAIDGIVQDALEGISDGLIVSSSALRENLSQRAAHMGGIEVGALEAEAVAAGLYTMLGRQYLAVLEAAVASLARSLAEGPIPSTSEFEAMLEKTATALTRFRPDGKAVTDLKIEARQRGLSARVEAGSHIGSNVAPDQTRRPAWKTSVRPHMSWVGADEAGAFIARS